MRTIKFRAWDGQRMNYLDYIWNNQWYLEPSGKGAKCSFDHNNSNDDMGRILNTHPEWLMQFTGLRDVKLTKEYPEGQEIYERDIIACDGMDNLKVIFYNGSFYAGDSGQLLSNYPFEVIGNQFENSKLLSSNKQESVS